MKDEARRPKRLAGAPQSGDQAGQDQTWLQATFFREGGSRNG